MPHSGGGGSHSGGSHSGGSHSSSSSSGRSSARISKTRFPGCRTYVIYKHNKPSRMVYTDRAYDTNTSTTGFVASTCFLSIFVIIGLVALYFGITSMFNFKTQTIDPPANNKIRIMDTHGFLSKEEESDLRYYLEKFYDTTGVVPAVMFTYDDYWEHDYVNCEAFAYDQYIYNFSDEKHVLIVYSFGYINGTTGFNEFHWESMWGDDLGRAIQTNDENYFRESMQRNLSRANGTGVAHAIGLSFEELTEHVTVDGPELGSKEEIYNSLDALLFGIFFGGIPLLIIISEIKDYVSKKGCVAYEVHKGMLQLNCEYCGCMYITGTISVCPHCGAAIPAYDPDKILDQWSGI